MTAGDREDLLVAIRFAARRSQIHLVRYLLDREFYDSDTVIGYILEGATLAESIECFELLQSRGWDINSKSHWDGIVPLT